MPQATRLGDNDTGHDACPPTALVSASGNVLINGKGAGRMIDTAMRRMAVSIILLTAACFPLGAERS